MARLEDTVYIGSSGTVHGLTPSFRAPTLADKDISGFITALSERGIVIEPKDSEKTVAYHIQNMQKTSRVPLTADFGPVSVKTIRYTLRGEGIEVTLRDYFSSTSSPGNRIGGSYTAKGGIQCSFVLEGDNLDTEKAEAIKRTVRGYYEVKATLPLPEGISRLLKQDLKGE